MSFHPNTPAQFSAGVGQEPQTPALAPRPHPAQILRYTLYRIGTKYRSGQDKLTDGRDFVRVFDWASEIGSGYTVIQDLVDF